MSVPAWFEKATYLDNKLAQFQQVESGATMDVMEEEFVKAGFDFSDEGAYRHFLEFGNTMDENVSPNALFVVEEYMANKLAQLQRDEPEKNWDAAGVKEAFEKAGLSAWDHYTLHGMKEGVNPSSGFDTNAYLDAKLAQWQEVEENPALTRDDLVQALLNEGWNPIEHYFLHGKDEGLDFNAGPEPEPFVLTTADDVFQGTADDEIISGTVGNRSATTLNAGDRIDGGAGNDTLEVSLAGNFKGFDEGFMKNVENVELSSGNGKAYAFAAKGVEGVETYTVTGDINLSDLTAGVGVNLAERQGQAKIMYADKALEGEEDGLVLGLSNVAGSKDAAVKVVIGEAGNGIETLTVNAEGKNVVDLRSVADMTALWAQGSGDLKIDAVAATLTEIDASMATGKLTVDASAATELASVILGAGDDTLTVTGNIVADALVDGGAGNDAVELADLNGKTLELRMANVENLNVTGNVGKTILAGGETSGLETVTFEANNASASLTLTEFSARDLNLDIMGKSSKVTVTDVEELNVTLGDGKTAVSAGDTLTALDVTDLTLNVAEKAAWNAGINAENLVNLTLNAKGGINLESEALQALETVTVTGDKTVSIDVAKLAGDQLSVNASALRADFTADFATTNSEDTAVDITGSRLGVNTITVNGFTDISVTGGLGDDIVSLGRLQAAGEGENKTLVLDMGIGTDTLKVSGNLSGWDVDLSGVEIIDAQGGGLTLNVDDFDGKSVEFKNLGSNVNWIGDWEDKDKTGITGDIIDDQPVSGDMDFSMASEDVEVVGDFSSFIGSSYNDYAVTTDSNATLVGGDGSNFLMGGKLLFAGSETTMNSNGVYAEAKNAGANGMSEKVGNVFLGGDGASTDDLWVSEDVVGLFKDHNVLDAHGTDGAIMVASEVADTFLFQVGGGDLGGGLSKDFEKTSATVEIHNFEVGQDTILLMNQGKVTDDGKTLTSAELSAEDLGKFVSVELDESGNSVLFIDWAAAGSWASSVGFDDLGETRITLMGLQGEVSEDTLPLLFGLEAVGA